MKGKVENISGIEKLEEIVQFAKDTLIDLVCIGPEQPLVDGLCDLMKAQVLMLTLLNFIFYRIFLVLDRLKMQQFWNHPKLGLKILC